MAAAKIEEHNSLFFNHARASGQTQNVRPWDGMFGIGRDDAHLQDPGNSLPAAGTTYGLAPAGNHERLRYRGVCPTCPTSELEHSACRAAAGGRIPIGIRIEVFA